MKKFYLSGPMTGIEEYNYPEFNRVAEMLRKDGYQIWNPVDLDVEEPAPEMPEFERWCFYIKRDLIRLMEDDIGGVILLEGWQNSKGALIELAVADSLQKQVLVLIEEGGSFALKARELCPVKEEVNILKEADNLVNGARQNAYGHPIDDYTRTAGIWSLLLEDKLSKPLTAEDAVMCMCAVKMSREVNKHKRDNLVDLAGYAQCLQMVIEKRKEK